MIRYRLLSPKPLDGTTPRTQALVWIDAPYRDQIAPIHVEGDPALVASVRDALAQLHGQSRASFGETAAPIDLCTAMSEPTLRPFEPTLLEGHEVLERRQPPAESPDDIAHELRLLVSDAPAWSPPSWAFDAVLQRMAAWLPEGSPLLVRLEQARSTGYADLRDLDETAHRQLLEAAHTAYVRLVRVWRAGFPDDRHAELVPELGSLLQQLETRAPRALQTWSVRRLQAFGGALEVCFPRELQRVLLPLLQHDVPQAEQLLRALRDRDLGEDASAIGGASFLPAGRNEVFLLECAQHRREEVRYRVMRMLAGTPTLPEPSSLAANFAPATIERLLRIGSADPSPRVRKRAIAYAYGLGQVALIRDQLSTALSPATRDPDGDCRAYALLALGLLTDQHSRSLLEHAYQTGTPDEVKAAVWALARRPDGVERVLGAVDDPRPEVQTEAIAAIGHVLGPLSAEQLAWLEEPARSPEVRQAAHKHRQRKGIPVSAGTMRIHIHD